MIPFEIVDYTFENFLHILAKPEVSVASNTIIKKKLHSTYFQEYFDIIGVKTIIVEYEYVDKDYLEDFSAYYVRSFKPYRRFCTRLHFFTSEFTNKDFATLLSGNKGKIDKDFLSKSYLGFVVVKPLPQTLVGRTCLVTYPDDERRVFPFIRKYPVNLFGISLEVHTIAFQEQDNVVAACASSAIWVAFQATGKIFQHGIPSPVEITKAATINLPYPDRYFPNKGLTSEQIAHAIRSQGLEPFLIDAKAYINFKSAVYSYLTAKIPLILGFSLFEIKNGTTRFLGKHAVTVTGFSLGEEKPIDYFNTDFYLTASRIDKIYVHDDQVGPFARMKFDNVDVTIIKASYSSLSTSWYDNDHKIGSVRAVPEILITPLYHKIRIPFNKLLEYAKEFNRVYNEIAEKFKLPLLEWDIHLVQVSDLKLELIDNPSLTEAQRLKYLTTSLPKFIWKLTCLVNPVEKIDFIFDATDIEQGSSYIQKITYNNQLAGFFKNVFSGLNTDLIDEPNVVEMIKDLIV